MPLFFIVSGLLFANSTHKQYSSMMMGKAKRLLLPYVFYHLLNLGLKVALPNLVNRKVESWSEYGNSILLRGGELWFLYVLFLLFLIWGFLLPRIRKQNVLIAILIILLILSRLSKVMTMENLFLYKEFLFYSFFFVGGYFLFPFYSKIRSVVKSAINKYLTLSVACFILVHSVNLMNFKYLSALIGIVLSLCLAFKMEKKSRGNSFLDYCGRNSLQFYFFNGFMLVISRVLVVNILHIANAFLIVLFIFLMCVITEVICVEVSRRVPLIKQCVGFK